MYLAALELLFAFLLSAYENFMAVKLVVPITQKPFDSVKDLYDSNYTFLVFQYLTTEALIKKEYQEKYKNEFIEVPSYNFGYERTKQYFWKQRDGSKYAVFDPFTGDNYFKNVIEVYTANLYECYNMYLVVHKALTSVPAFFMIHSAIAPHLKVGYQKYLASGIKKLITSSTTFKISVSRTKNVRKVRQTDEDFEALLRLKESSKVEGNMITLGNCVKVFRLALSVMVISFVVFLWENTRHPLRKESILLIYYSMTNRLFKLKDAIKRHLITTIVKCQHSANVIR